VNDYFTDGIVNISGKRIFNSAKTEIAPEDFVGEFNSSAKLETKRFSVKSRLGAVPTDGSKTGVDNASELTNV